VRKCETGCNRCGLVQVISGFLTKSRRRKGEEKKKKEGARRGGKKTSGWRGKEVNEGAVATAQELSVEGKKGRNRIPRGYRLQEQQVRKAFN